ncbi:MAG: hypothetical protein KME22_27050 [Hassallia sp. WJT32-NPBG1]|nr:hypothetical protein [Hassallia sp. WJT32-NPBG1]
MGCTWVAGGEKKAYLNRIELETKFRYMRSPHLKARSPKFTISQIAIANHKISMRECQKVMI